MVSPLGSIHGLFCGEECGVEEYIAYFMVKCFVWLLGRIYGIFCFEEIFVAVRKNKWHIFW